MTPPPATLADLLAWRPLPGCRLFVMGDPDGRRYAVISACCAAQDVGQIMAETTSEALHAVLDRKAKYVLKTRDRRHAAHPDACRGDVLAVLAARGAEAVGAGAAR